MDEEHKKQVAVFRFGAIHDFVGGPRLDHGERERFLREKSNRIWQIPFSTKTRISRTTLLRWVKMYEAGGRRLESLYPGSRSDQGKARAIDEETACSLIALRQKFPRASVSWLIDEMEKRVLAGTRLSRSTVYRFLHNHGLMHPRPYVVEDRRRFEAELPNDVWQSDSMHGPTVEVKGKTKKTYLFAFLDDHSRLICHAEFYLREDLEAYLDALRQALLRRGLPRKLYVDNAAAFRSKHLEFITASLGIALVHSRPYTPQGRGKIERFFRTLRNQFLMGFCGQTLEELNLSLGAWIRDVYHTRPHTSTAQSPLGRFSDHTECIRLAPKDLDDYFRKTARRRVAKDRTISLHGRLFEAPVALIGKQVLLLYHDSRPQEVEVIFDHQSHGLLTPVDLHVNWRIRRDKNRSIQIDPHTHRYQGGSLWNKKDNQ